MVSLLSSNRYEYRARMFDCFYYQVFHVWCFRSFRSYACFRDLVQKFCSDDNRKRDAFFRDIASSEHGCHDVMWAKMFDSCANKDEHLTTGLVRGFQTLLQRYKVQAPACLAEVVSRGIPCTCNTAEAVLPASPAFGLRKVSSVRSYNLPIIIVSCATPTATIIQWIQHTRELISAPNT